MLRVAIAFLLSGVTTIPAFAQQIVKCTDTTGRIEYRNSPCPSGTTREAVQISNLSFVEAERRSDANRRTDDSAQPARRPVQSPAALPPMLAPGMDRGTTNPGTQTPSNGGPQR